MTYYKIPSRTTLMEPTIDSLYGILPACNNVHILKIPQNGFVKINIVNAEPNTQDMSMRGWVSDSIMGDMLFYDIRYNLCPFSIPRMYSYDNINVPTLGLEFKIYDKTNIQSKDELYLDSDNEYFICIQNIQNKRNAYRLILSTEDIVPNYDDQLSNGSGFSCCPTEKNVYDGNGNFRYTENNCKCECHTKKRTRSKKPCPICGCLPINFSRDNLT
ncbi:MAG: hypothetical protein [Caudoviricetes sp.]|nr:MAG: hypothetical protein [Caudoviricetes sp.]